MNKTSLFPLLGSLTLMIAAALSTSCASVEINDLNQNGNIEPYENTALSTSQRVNDLVSRLSLEDKVKLVTGTGFNMQEGGSQKVPGAAGSTHALPEFGIPAMVLADGPAGLRIEPRRKSGDKTYYATAFPIATALASSWDKELVRQVGVAMGEEVKEYGVDLFLAPGMNLQYNPLGGRNFEYYSEDPYLSGNMAAAMVNGVESNGVGATIKHFVANNAETDRFWLDAHINDRAMRELYLRGFEIAIKAAQPWAIMTSYNKVNGVYTSQDENLLRTVLRDEWGFNGLVMTDWFAGDSAVAQMRAGNNLIMPGMPDQRQAIFDAVSNGTLSEKTLDSNVSAILSVLFTSPTFNDYSYSDQPDLSTHAEVARQAAGEGIVLLKNNGKTLPLTGELTAAAFGNTSYDFIAGGTGSGDVNEAYTVSLVDGFVSSPLSINISLQTAYEAHIASEKAKLPEKKNFFDLLPPIPEYMPSDETIVSMAKNTDVALITLGRNAGEFQDRKVEEDFELTASEMQLITKVSDAFHGKGKKVVVILNVGGVIETASWRNKVDSIVLPWQGGQEAGNAVVDVLTGKVTPSGKLTTSFPFAYNDVSSSTTFPGHHTSDEFVTDPYLGLFKGYHGQLDYVDDIFVGYRYYDTFNVDTAYPFGFGLSYTTFGYSNLVASETENGEYNISVKIKNTGETDGKEVVQVYLGAPQGDLPKPPKELREFAKTMRLKPGEEQTLHFTLPLRAFTSFDPGKQAWIADKGDYTVLVGSSSADIRLTTRITLTQSREVENVRVKFSPTPAISVLAPE